MEHKHLLERLRNEIQDAIYLSDIDCPEVLDALEGMYDEVVEITKSFASALTDEIIMPIIEAELANKKVQDI